MLANEQLLNRGYDNDSGITYTPPCLLRYVMSGTSYDGWMIFPFWIERFHGL